MRTTIHAASPRHESWRYHYGCSATPCVGSSGDTTGTCKWAMLFNHHIRFLLTKGIPSYRHKKVYDGNFKTKFQKLGLGLNLKECTSSFAPASQQRIKRLKPTNTRLKHQSEQFWVAEKTTKGGGALKRPAPLCVFLGSQNSSNCCLNLVFVLSILWFNLLILCWLAGANDEVIDDKKFTWWR